jgi:hypothetical protein
MGPAPLRAELRRAGVLLQFRHRGQRGGDQAHPPPHRRREVQGHHLPRRLPRPHVRQRHRHRPAEIPRRPGADAFRLPVRPPRRSRCGGAARRRPHRRDPHRADPRRRGHCPRPAGLPRGAEADLRRARSRPRLRRGPVGLRPDGRMVRLPALRRPPRRDHARQEPVRGGGRRRDAHHPGARPAPPAGDACLHVRRQSDCRPGRDRRHRDDRERGAPRPRRHRREHLPRAARGAPGSL